VLVFRDVTEEYRIREALRVNEERQNLALSGANEGIWDWNVVTNQAFFDSGYYTMAGYEPHEFPGSLDEWVSRMHPDDVYATVTAAKRYVAGEAEDYDVEFRFRRKDGDYMWIRARGNVVERDEQGEPIRCAGTHSDITEKKRMETQLRASQQLLSNVFETLEEGVFTLDTELRFTYLNRRMEQLIATDREQVLGVPAEQWLTAFGSGIAPMMGDALRGNATRKFHIQHGSQIGGRRKWLSLSFLPLRGSDDRITGLVSIVEDITVRREAEDQLRNLRNYLSNVIDSMPSSLIGVDVEGRVTQWNRTVESLLGISAGVALGRKLQTLLPEFDLLHERISESIESREVIHEQKVVRQQETTRYEEITIYPLMTDGIEGAVIRIDDVTEKARLEEMMVQSEKMLSVGGLAAGMAHEINNPLAGMMQTAGVMASRLGGNLQLESSRRAAEAAGTSLEAIQKFMQLRGIPRMLATITESGSRAAEIVENMLSFARKGNATTSSHQLDELVDRTLELASTDYDLKKHYDFRSITIERRYAPGLQPVPCEGSKIQQVLLNILRNGAQAMQEAEVDKPTFIVSTALDEAQGMQCISIEDNGPGMDEQTRKRVFEPFFTTKPVDAGTGLGLSVSYFIVTKNHGGLMTVDSVPGKGATFTLCLPLVQPVQ
jgi:PAS domain S-box-containing protein